MLWCFIFNLLTLLLFEWERIGFAVLGGDGVAIIQWSRELAVYITRSGFDGVLMSASIVRRGSGFVAWHGYFVFGGGQNSNCGLLSARLKLESLISSDPSVR